MSTSIFSAAMSADSNGLFGTLDAELEQAVSLFSKQNTARLRLRFFIGIQFAWVNQWVSKADSLIHTSFTVCPHQLTSLGRWGFSFPPLHAAHFSIYMLKMVGSVTILGPSQHNNSAALSDLELLNYLK
jgi:hypothetical protein